MGGDGLGTVLAVSLNPALDVTYRVGRLDVGEAGRVSTVERAAGGKAVNVARVLHALGQPVTLLTLAGGCDGAQLCAGVEASGVALEVVTIAAETRRTITIVDDRSVVTGLWEPGPPVTAEEWASLQRRFAELVGHHRVVVCSGSLPAGLASGAYATLTGVAHRAGCKVIVDADGPALLAALPAAPDVVKPNRRELAQACEVLGAAAPALGAEHPGEAVSAGTVSVGTVSAGTVPGDADLSDAAAGEAAPGDAEMRDTAPGDADGSQRSRSVRRDLDAAAILQRAGARAVVVSAGAEGMTALVGSEAWSARSPRVTGGNPTGAGDAAVAGLARGLLTGLSWPEMLADATALAAAAVACPTAGTVSSVDYERWRLGITIEPRAPGA